MRLVLDSSAVIELSLGEVLEKVCEVFEVYVPRAVFHEIAEVGYCRVGSHELRKLVETGKVLILEPQDVESVKLLMDPLGRGEAETIEIARELRLTAVIDDKIARRKAKELGISIIGTIKVFKLLLERNVITKEEAISGIEKLKKNGFRVSDKIISMVFSDKE